MLKEDSVFKVFQELISDTRLEKKEVVLPGRIHILLDGDVVVVLIAEAQVGYPVESEGLVEPDFSSGSNEVLSTVVGRALLVAVEIKTCLLYTSPSPRD